MNVNVIKKLYSWIKLAMSYFRKNSIMKETATKCSIGFNVLKYNKRPSNVIY